MAKIAILGFGIVGSGIAEVLTRSSEHIQARTGEQLELGYILDIRDFPGNPYEKLMTSDFNVILRDPEIEAVCEAIGGTGVAYDFTRRCLAAGKSVVTSNKELVAEHGAELLALARENNAAYLFEASVGGGVPVIRPMSRCLAANRITEVTGILNGTSNYILTRMSEDGISLEEALTEAKSLGYAEHDPSDDIGGKDACRKICILASLAFGRHIYPKFVKTEGISGITSHMLAKAKSMGWGVKHIGKAKLLGNGHVEIITAPYLVPEAHPLHAVNGVFNGIIVNGDATGEVMFYGKGAGGQPTASAIIADIIDCIRCGKQPPEVFWKDAPGGVSAPEGEETYTFSTGETLRIL